MAMVLPSERIGFRSRTVLAFLWLLLAACAPVEPRPPVERVTPAEAAARFEAAWRRQPDYLEARFNHGTTLARLGRLDEAVAQWREVLRIDPADADARQALEHAAALGASP